MKKQMRIALVGCGGISSNHISGILEAGGTLCALCDVEPVRAEKKITRHALSDVAVYTDYSEMLKKEKPDVVHICTPHDLHAPMAIEALEQNIHVLCEKPLCISMEQLEALRVAEKNSKAQLGVCHQNRWKSSMVELKRLAAEGLRGAFGSVVWERDADYYRADAWRGTWEHEGGGVMINQAIHTLDLLQWICGMPIQVISEVGNWTHQDVIEVEDTASARFVCENGLVINFFATTSAGVSMPISVQVMLADKTKITAQNDFLVVGEQLIPLSSKRKAPLGKEVWGSEHAALIEHFYHCVSEGEHFPIDVEEGGRVIRLILSMYRSHGKQIEILN